MEEIVFNVRYYQLTKLIEGYLILTNKRIFFRAHKFM